MRNLYFFILGRNPTLSIAEIINQINEKIVIISNDFLVLESSDKLSVEDLQKKLGGTIKIGLIIDEAKNFKPERAVEILSAFHRPHFGFSFYENSDYFLHQSKKWAMEIKIQLKEKNIPSRWVTSKEKTLSSVVVQKNKLLTEGAEFCFLGTQINTKKKINKQGNNQCDSALSHYQSVYVGKTLTCQEFEEYSERDYGRPARKIEKGILPSKLAKIMINLTRVSTNGVILDPFCGSGTILQEAALMGYKNIIGTDISQEAIKNSQENIRWLFEKSNFKFQISKPQLKIQKSDVKNLSKIISKKSVDAIITEPYLGPIKIKNIKDKIKNIENELSTIYLDAFKQFKNVLKPNGQVVIIFPIFLIDVKLHFLPILDKIKKTGWQIINPIPPKLQKNSVIKITNRNSIIYFRPKQKVLREIFIFKNA